MKRRKIAKKKIILHPVMAFLLLAVIIIVLSGLLKLFNVSFSYNTISASRHDYISANESINSLLNLRGVKYIFSNTVSNFANFTVLSHLIIVLLGIGVMDASGFLKTAIGFFTKKAKKKHITFFIVLICLLSSILGNLPFIAFIPLTALIYRYGKRNPLLGVATSFAALTCGYGLSIFMTAVDSSLSDITVLAASMLDSTYAFKTFSLLGINIIAIIILAFVITEISENYLVRKLPKYDFEETEVLTSGELSFSQKRGLIFAALGSLLYLLIFIYNIIPGLPFSGNFLNYSETLYINKLFGANSFFADGFVFVVTLLFIIWGGLYGLGAKTIKNNRDFVADLGYSLNGIGKILVYIFASATFISIFKQTNIGNVITAGLSSLISNVNPSGLLLIILLFIVSGIATFFLPGSAAKWTIIAPNIVPVFLNAGLSAEFAQVIFRFGECTTLGLTPLFAYFIVYLAYLEKYNQDEVNMNLFSAIKYQSPFAGLTACVLLAIIILFYFTSIPLGIGGSIAI